MRKSILNSIVMILTMTLLTGVCYPLVVMGIAKICFPKTAESTLMEQDFKSDLLFWGRPGSGERGSGATQLAPGDKRLQVKVMENYKRFKVAIGGTMGGKEILIDQVPYEFLFQSGSGLDPHISVRGALLQVERVAKARKDRSIKELQELIRSCTEFKMWNGLLGQDRVNVVLLNKSL